MIKLNQAVIVEGKYDKITLENVIDTTIIVTDGFRIFKNKEKRELIRLLAERRGIIVITDSDSAGAVIRSYLKQICPEGTIANVYIPQLSGKEKRKTKPSKEGFLGVEGMTQQALVDALARSGITGKEIAKRTGKRINKTTFFTLGLSGGNNSSYLREELAQHLNLPKGMSSNAFLDCVNAVFEYDEFVKAVELWQKLKQDADKK
ncbi:MAG: DUF4093 domain-containing protein [Ruminococcaceae bacterium]|nr:DUF4093 domain-containing protein [Oscillospiraceae bacterium]